MIDNLKIVSTLYSMGITKDEVYKYVTDGKIKPEDYKTIVGEDCPEVSLDTLKQIKISELEKTCNETIVNGFMSDADGESKVYDFELENQVNISVFKSNILIGQLAGQTIPNISYYAKGGECHEYTPDQFLKLANDAETFKLTQITKYKSLKAEVTAATTKEAIDAITW
jgi:hypothetical protein